MAVFGEGEKRVAKIKFGVGVRFFGYDFYLNWAK